MENHVKYILKSYPDAWAIDVVNEAVDDWPVKWRKDSTEWYAGTENDRNNPETIPEYIKKAFQFTRKHSPNAKLGYNDYNIAKGGDKANFIVKFVKKMKKDNIPIDYLGFQFHEGWTLNLNKTLKIFWDLYKANIDVHITELDIEVSKGTFTKKLEKEQALQYAAIAYLARFYHTLKFFKYGE